MKTIYLAGCDVFREDSESYYLDLKIIAKKYGFLALSPFEVSNRFEGEPFSQEHSQYLFVNNVNLIRDCDVVIANLIPFRGACVDDGTAWEVGCGYAFGKVLYGYTPFYDISLAEITKLTYPNYKTTNFPIIEAFNNNPVNLMIYESIYSKGGKILESFEDCMIDLKKTHGV